MTLSRKKLHPVLKKLIYKYLFIHLSHLLLFVFLSLLFRFTVPCIYFVPLLFNLYYPSSLFLEQKHFVRSTTIILLVGPILAFCFTEQEVYHIKQSRLFSPRTENEQGWRLSIICFIIRVFIYSLGIREVDSFNEGDER